MVNKKKYGTGGVLTKFPLYHQRLHEYNNVTDFIKGLTNDKTFKSFFQEGYSEPNQTSII